MPTCILAVDTATEICGVALAIDDQVKTELILSQSVTHTQSLMVAVESVLAMNHMDISAIDVYAVTRGPGSFTGLRIGISTVKGLALALAKPMVGISSLEVLANQAPGFSDLICPIMDARRNEVYWTLYRRTGADKISTAMGEQVGPVSAMAESIEKAHTRGQPDVEGLRVVTFGPAGDGVLLPGICLGPRRRGGQIRIEICPRTPNG